MTNLNLTEKELTAIKLFIDESFDCCGEFSEDENISYMNIVDLAQNMSISKSAAAGLFSALDSKNLIVDTQESARGANISDWFACPVNCAKYPQIASYIAECE